MKFRKFFCGFLFGLGCVILFIGLAATVLPLIQNDQLHLVLSSFEMPSQNILVNAMNSVMNYALRNCYLVMLIGAAIAFIGVMLMIFTRPAPTAHEVPHPVRSAYVVASADDAVADVPVWHATRAPTVREKNPFADTSLAELLTPGAAKPVPESNPFAAFAPASRPKPVQPIVDEPVIMPVVSPYARPADAQPVQKAESEQATAPEASPVTAQSVTAAREADITAGVFAAPSVQSAPAASFAAETIPQASSTSQVLSTPLTPPVLRSPQPTAEAPAIVQTVFSAASAPSPSGAEKTAGDTTIAPIASQALSTPSVVQAPQPTVEAPAIVQTVFSAASAPSPSGAEKTAGDTTIAPSTPPAPQAGAGQSGSHVVIRSTFTSERKEDAPSVTSPLADPPTEESAIPVAQAVQPDTPVTAPRIKSTMGKHH